MLTLVILCTLYTLVYPVNPCLTQSYCIPCIPLYILFTHVTLVTLYTLHTSIYPVYPCLPYSYVYTLSCLPMFTLVILYTLYTLVYLVYPSHPVYPCLPQSDCIPCIPLYILSISFPLYRKSWLSFYAYDQSLSDTRKNFFLHVNDSLSFVNEWLIVRQGLQKLIFVTLLLLSFSLFFFCLINFINYRNY